MKSKLNLLEKGYIYQTLGVRINKFLHWHDQVNSNAVKLNIFNALLLKIRNYVKMTTLRNIYFAIFEPNGVLFQLKTLIQFINYYSSGESTTNHEFYSNSL